MSDEARVEQTVIERRMKAFLDNEDSESIANPIHSSAVARKHGFAGPLVGGVTVWGWSTPAILDALGDAWLDHGWAEFRFRRPIYPNDDVRIRLQPRDDGAFTHTMSNAEGVDCVVGAVGLGDGAWAHEFTTPTRTDGAAAPDPKPDLVLDRALIGSDWTPMAVSTSATDMVAYVVESHRMSDPRFVGEAPHIHPAWLAAQAERIMRHNWSLPQSIHTESRVQYLAPALAGEPITVSAHCLDVYERKERHLVQFDCLLRSESGVDIARLRHTTIFRLPPV